jgi:hypothetical protein
VGGGRKAVPWAEWVGERELQWIIELPHRKLEGILRQAREDAGTFHVVTESTPARAQEPRYSRHTGVRAPGISPSLNERLRRDTSKGNGTNADSEHIRAKTLARGGELRTA